MTAILLIATAFWLAPALAEAAPVATAIVAWVGITGTAATIATFVIATVLTTAATWAVTKLTAPGQRSALQERQASVISLGLGEAPREAIFGQAATGGQLLDAFNWGGSYGTDWEVLVIQLADHRCHSLVAFYIGDQRHVFTASGIQEGFNGQLEIYWHEGAADQAADTYLTTHAPGGAWTSSDRLAGCAYVVVAYKADAPDASSPVWPQGRPGFLWEVKGAYLYDPRKDSTVTGGSGAHRWTNPATWEWSDNAYLARYAYTRGLYAGDAVGNPAALLIGRGLSADEAPPERVFAAANLCDEAVALKAGGTEPRYRANGVIRSDETFIAVDETFAATMAGVIVQRDGGVEIEPGEARSAVVALTDADLLVGASQRVEVFRPDADRVNTVAARYVDPGQLWRETAAPVRRSTDDMTNDGGPREQTLSLSLVTSQTQAQRIAEIERRLARRERRATITLGPRFSWLEEGDWLTWTSDRHFLGATITFRVEAASLGPDYRMTLVLREIAASTYAWTAASDEGTPGQAPVDAAGGLDPLELEDVVITAFALTGDSGDSLPAVKATWATPVELGVRAIRLEVRRQGETEIAATLAPQPNMGEMIATNGVPSSSAIEARLVPLGVEGRRATPSPWVEVSSGSLSLASILAALSDGVLTPGEKILVVPQIGALIDARPSLRARADAVSALYSNNLERVAYEDSTNYLFALLATLTDPVAWDDASGPTEIPDPAEFTTAFRAAISSERNLQSAVTQLWGNRLNLIDATVLELADDGVLTPAEKMLIIPQINAAIAARAHLRDSANDVGLAYGGDPYRTAFEDAAVYMDAVLAAILTPIAWNNYTDKSILPDPAAFRYAFEIHTARGLDLQSQIDRVAATRTTAVEGNVVGLQDKTYYIDPSGRIYSHLALPVNAVTGNGAYKTVWPFVPYADAMRVNGFTEYRTGENIFFPTGDIYGLTPGTPYDFFYSYPSAAFIAVDLAYSYNFLIEAYHYVYVGRQTTLAADSGPPPPAPAPPPGYGGGGARNPYIFIP